MSSALRRAAVLLSLTALLAGATHAAPRLDSSPDSHPGDGTTVEGVLWRDANCDGVRQNDEGPMSDNPRGWQGLSLFYVGSDGLPFTPDDREIAEDSPLNGNPIYSFSGGGGGHVYYIAIRPADRPSAYLPGPLPAAGGVTNHLKLWPDAAWATGAFVIPDGTGLVGGPPAVTGIDIGLCPSEVIPRPFAARLPLVARR